MRTIGRDFKDWQQKEKRERKNMRSVQSKKRQHTLTTEAITGEAVLYFLAGRSFKTELKKSTYLEVGDRSERYRSLNL